MPHVAVRAATESDIRGAALFEILIMEPGLCAVLEAPDASNTSIRAYIEEHQNKANIAGQALELLNDGVTSYEEFERITLNL